MKEIIFSPAYKDVVGVFSPPTPAASTLPEWYKNQPGLVDDKIILNDSGVANLTAKKCMPILDDITAGYIMKLESDVIVTSSNETGSTHHSLKWSMSIPDGLQPLIGTHTTHQVSHLPIPLEYSVHPFKWHNYWRILTPPGYSCMFRHPFWHGGLPFLTCSGIVDTDTYPLAVNFPFFLRNDFEGLIPLGTPIVQIIPFKRQEWVSSVKQLDLKQADVEWKNATKKIMHRYKDNWRKIKSWK